MREIYLVSNAKAYVSGTVGFVQLTVWTVTSSTPLELRRAVALFTALPRRLLQMMPPLLISGEPPLLLPSFDTPLKFLFMNPQVGF